MASPAYLQRVWSGWYSAPAQDTLCSRFIGSIYDERGPTHASYTWPTPRYDTLRLGAIFEHVQRSPPTFPTMPLCWRSLPLNLQSLPFNSRLFPIGPNFQIGLDWEGIVAQWNGGIRACCLHGTNRATVTLRPEKADHILLTTFWNAFSSMEIIVFWFKFHWTLFPGD